MNDLAAQVNLEDNFSKSKRAAFLNAFKCKTGLILDKATAMRINANLEPSSVGAPAPSLSSPRLLFCLSWSRSCRILILLAERIVHLWSCARLALL
jgi:hypothetical protein